MNQNLQNYFLLPYGINGMKLDIVNERKRDRVKKIKIIKCLADLYNILINNLLDLEENK